MSAPTVATAPTTTLPLFELEPTSTLGNTSVPTPDDVDEVVEQLRRLSLSDEPADSLLATELITRARQLLTDLKPPF